MAVISPYSDAYHSAMWRRARRAGTRVLFVVFHDMEAPETSTMATDLGKNYFADPRDANGRRVKASTHTGVDSTNVVTYVYDDEAAYGSHGNDYCLHVEHAGYARQTRGEWLDTYGRAMLDRSARYVAERCHAYGLPPTFCDAQRVQAAIASGNPAHGGVTTHKVMTDALGNGRGHTDPGVFWPEDVYMSLVQEYHRSPRERPILVQGDYSGKPSLGASAGSINGDKISGAPFELQTFLRAEGYDLGRFGPNEDGIDGDIGRITIAAVVKCRADNNLAPLTIVDGEFWELIDRSVPQPEPPAPTPDPTPDTGPSQAELLEQAETSAARTLALVKQARR